MDQAERRQYLIRYLLSENPEYNDTAIPADEYGQKRLLRSLFNIRLPGGIGEDFLAVQDEYLREAIREKGITDASSLAPAAPGVYLWQGDITTLKCGAIVNAANSGMTGCYVPCLEAADSVGTDSIAFCCISTGVFGFPQKAAAEVAVRTVKEYKNETGSAIEVIFNVFKDEDLAIYRELLGQYQ